MNICILVGRLTKDPEISVSQNQIPCCKFTVAVDRRFKDQNGQRQTDFINCVAWRQTAQFVGNYFRKGSRIGITGSIQTRSYDDQYGQKKYVTEIIVDAAEFVDSKQEAAPAQPQIAPPMPTAPVAPAPVAAPAAPAPSMADLRPKPPMQNVSISDLEQYGQLPFEL